MYAFDDLDLSVKSSKPEIDKSTDILCCKSCGSATSGCVSVFFTGA